MNKGELIDMVAQRLGGSKASAGRAVDAVIESLAEGIRERDAVTIVGFGTFQKRHRGPRTLRNPSTGEPMYVEESDTVAFRPSPALKRAMSPEPVVNHQA